MQALVRLMTAQKCIDHNAEHRIYFLQPFHIMSVFKISMYLNKKYFIGHILDSMRYNSDNLHHAI